MTNETSKTPRTNESKTPRTDEEQRRTSMMFDRDKEGSWMRMVQHSQELEIELNETKERIATQEKVIGINVSDYIKVEQERDQALKELAEAKGWLKHYEKSTPYPELYQALAQRDDLLESLYEVRLIASSGKALTLQLQRIVDISNNAINSIGSQNEKNESKEESKP